MMINKILIVDDEVETLRLISIALQRQGLQIITANNGTQALDLAITENPSLIILDIMMPDISGFEVVKRLKKNKNTADIPVLIFSARNQLDDKVTGYESGADDYLTKPIHPAELVSRVKTLLEKNLSPDKKEESKTYTVGVVGAAGGVGTSTIAINIACNITRQIHTRVLVAEMTPGHGSFEHFYGTEAKKTLEDYLKLSLEDINAKEIQNQLIHTNFGPYVLPASGELENIQFNRSIEQAELIVREIKTLAPLLILDFGQLCWADYPRLLNYCNELIIVTSPLPGIISKTSDLISQLSLLEFDSTKPLNVVSVSHARSSISLTMQEMEDRLHHTISHVIPAAPEQAYQAELAHRPIGMMRSNDLISQQIANVTSKVLARFKEFTDTISGQSKSAL
ncbi:MAG: response regulator [Anaerolineaceae bacterium]|nr:response regulator [Anaerolineaceae bacterium]